MAVGESLTFRLLFPSYSHLSSHGVYSQEKQWAFHNLTRCLQFPAFAYRCAGIMAPGICLVLVLMKGLEGNPQAWGAWSQ